MVNSKRNRISLSDRVYSDLVTLKRNIWPPGMTESCKSCHTAGICQVPTVVQDVKIQPDCPHLLLGYDAQALQVQASTLLQAPLYSPVYLHTLVCHPTSLKLRSSYRRQLHINHQDTFIRSGYSGLS